MGADNVNGLAQGTGTMTEHSLTWIFVVGMLFSFMDAFGIGANDVANSFATSVGSQVLTLRQACFIALFTEFLGAIALGANTTNTIRSGILDVNMFNGRPDLLMFGMMCAMIGSSFWVLLATRLGMPVSTTHSIVGAVMGIGISCFGFDAVDWGWDGVGKILASFAISPILSGCVAAALYLITKYAVLIWPNSFNRALWLTPVYAFVTVGIVMAFWVTKGTPALKLDQKPAGVQCAIIFGVTGFVTLLAACVGVPLMRRRANKEEKVREEIAREAREHGESVANGDEPNTVNVDAVNIDSIAALPSTAADADKPYSKAMEAAIPTSTRMIEEPRSGITDLGSQDSDSNNDDPNRQDKDKSESTPSVHEPLSSVKPIGPMPSWKENKKAFVMYWLNRTIFHGVNQEVVYYKRDKVQKIHDRATKFPDKTERVFSWLQVVTACMASFAHGANDVANAIGPLATVYYIWENGTVPGKKAPVPTWILAYGGVGIQVGLLLYGYNIMRNLGNNLTHMSPTRGFSMELGAVLTVLVATYLEIPVSTTHCITGATVAVGLCNGDIKAVNWKMMLWCCFGWLLTLPLAAGVAAIATAFGAGAPNFKTGYPDPAPV